MTLSDKRKYTRKDGLFDKLRCHSLDKHIVYPEIDVKEFIKTLREEIENWDVEPCCHGIQQDKLLFRLNILVGEKLL